MSPRGVQSRFGGPGGFGFGPFPRDVKILVAVQLATFLLRLVPGLRAVPARWDLALTPMVLRGSVWQLATYPFIGYGTSILVLLELFGVLLIASPVYYGLGRRHFWRMMIGGAVLSAVVAVLFYYFFAGGLGGWNALLPFSLMQGQRVLLMMLVASFSFANPEAQFLLFFVIPIKARWFLPLVFAAVFISFLGSHDVGGFVGLCSAAAFVYVYRQSGGGVSWRWGRKSLREMRLRIERWWIGKKLDRMKKKRGFRVISGEGEGKRGEVKKGPWVH